MTPELWAVIVGIGVLVVTRVLDFFFPRGYRWKGLDRYAKKHATENDEEESGDTPD